MKNLQTYIILALTAVIVWLLLTKPEPEPVTIENPKHERQLDSLNSALSSLLNDQAEDSLRYLGEKHISDRKISSLTAKLREKRVEIDTFIVTNPAVLEYVTLADSVISSQGARINALEDMYGRLEHRTGQLQANFEAQIAAHLQREQELTEANAELSKKLLKKSRAVKLWKALAVVGFVGGVLIGSQ